MNMQIVLTSEYELTTDGRGQDLKIKFSTILLFEFHIFSHFQKAYGVLFECSMV